MISASPDRIVAGLPGTNGLTENTDLLQDHPLRKGGGRQVHTMTGCSRWGVQSVAFSRDGTRVVSMSRHSRVKIWNVETGVEVRSVAGVR